MKCIECGQKFDLKETAEHYTQYYQFPYNYGQGEHRYCLECWLGVGPNAVREEERCPKTAAEQFE